MPSDARRSQAPTREYFGLACLGLVLDRTRSAPFEKGVESGAHQLSPVGERILDLRRDLRVGGSGHDSVSLELAQLLDQHLLRYGGDGAFEFGKAQDFLSEQVEDDDQLPAPLDQSKRRLGAGGRHIRRHVA